MNRFTYTRAYSVGHAVDCLQKDDDARIVSGGMTLIPALKQRVLSVSNLVDIDGLAQLKGIRESDDSILIGGMTTHAEVAHSSLVRDRLPGLAELAASIGDAQVRNRGTIGGSVANNDPAADYPAGLLGLAATVVTDRREIAAADFFLGMFETALEPAEIVTGVRFPRSARCAYAKFRNPVSGYALVGVFVAEADGRISAGVTGAGASAFRCLPVEAELAKSFTAEAAERAEVKADGLLDDMHASAAFRANLIRVMAGRATAALSDRKAA